MRVLRREKGGREGEEGEKNGGVEKTEKQCGGNNPAWGLRASTARASTGERKLRLSNRRQRNHCIVKPRSRFDASYSAGQKLEDEVWRELCFHNFHLQLLDYRYLYRYRNAFDCWLLASPTSPLHAMHGNFLSWVRYRTPSPRLDSSASASRHTSVSPPMLGCWPHHGFLPASG